VARCARYRQGVVLNEKGAGLVAAGRGSRVVLAELDVQAEAFRALSQQVPVGKTHELAGELAGRYGKAQFRPDTGRLAGGKGYAGKGRTQSLYST
jgi:hypothetical protein